MRSKVRWTIVLAGTLLFTAMAFSDGSDPMPLCRAKNCGPIKGKAQATPVLLALPDGGPLPLCPPKCGRYCSLKTPGCGIGGFLTTNR